MVKLPQFTVRLQLHPDPVLCVDLCIQSLINNWQYSSVQFRPLTGWVVCLEGHNGWFSRNPLPVFSTTCIYHYMLWKTVFSGEVIRLSWHIFSREIINLCWFSLYHFFENVCKVVYIKKNASYACEERLSPSQYTCRKSNPFTMIVFLPLGLKNKRPVWTEVLLPLGIDTIVIMITLNLCVSMPPANFAFSYYKKTCTSY